MSESVLPMFSSRSFIVSVDLHLDSKGRHWCRDLLSLWWVTTFHVLYSHPPSVKVKGLVVQSCLILCEPTDCSLPGSPVHRILQARVLEWVSSPGQGSNPGLLHCRQIIYHLSHQTRSFFRCLPPLVEYSGLWSQHPIPVFSRPVIFTNAKSRR